MMITDPRWTALDESRRDELLNEYRDTNIGFGERWREGVDVQIREEMEEIGIRVTQLYFSGFWSQGDGAAIEGYVDDWFKVFTHLKDPYAEARARLANTEGGRSESTAPAAIATLARCRRSTTSRRTATPSTRTKTRYVTMHGALRIHTSLVNRNLRLWRSGCSSCSSSGRTTPTNVWRLSTTT